MLTCKDKMLNIVFHMLDKPARLLQLQPKTLEV